MEFNDDDLKRLKKLRDAEEDDRTERDERDISDLTWGKLPALLARLEAAESSLKWLEGFIELAEETLKVHQLGGQTMTEMRFRENHGRLRIDEIKRDLEFWRKKAGK